MGAWTATLKKSKSLFKFSSENREKMCTHGIELINIDLPCAFNL